MATIERFEDFEAYKKARIFVNNIYQISLSGSFSKDFVLKDQINRAAVSITSNFAEGHGRGGNKEFLQFICYSKGSLSEVKSQLHLAIDRKHIDQKQHDRLQDEADQVANLLGGLERYLKSSPLTGRRYKTGDSSSPTQNPKPKTPNPSSPTPNSKRRTPNSPQGFAIISTLLVLTVLTIMVVAFMQSMRVERLTARSYLNKTRAELLAQAALEDALNKVSRALPQGANLDKGFVTWSYSNNNNFSPYYVGILPKALDTTVSYNTPASVLDTIWLFSTPVAAASAEVTTEDWEKSGNQGPDFVLALTDPKKYVDFNRGGKIDGDGTTAYKAAWIYKREDGVEGRFAYWIDDESGKLDMMQTGNASQTVGNNGNWSDVVMTKTLPVPATREFPGTEMNEVIAQRTAFGWPSPTSILQSAPSLKDSKLSHTLDKKQEVNNLIAYGPRYGQPRKNLNTAVTTAATPQAAVEDINTWIESSLPQYTMRKNGTPGTTKRLAASIVDYIDADNTPTLSTNWTSIDPETMISAGPAYTDASMYYGIEAIPRVNELLFYWGTASDPAYPGNPRFEKAAVPGGFRYRIGVTRHVELWNSHNKTITLPNLYIRFFLQPRIGIFGTFGGSETSIPYLTAETIPISTTPTNPPTPSPITLAPNQFRTFPVTGVYEVRTTTDIPSFTTLGDQIPAGNLGFVLFTIDGSGQKRILDSFFPAQPQANPASEQAGTNPGYSGSGDSQDTRTSMGRYLLRWASQTATGGHHSFNSPNNTLGRTYQNMDTWFDRPKTGGAQGVSPLEAPNYVANAPMKSLGELGNIFDPTADIKEINGRPRGTKTLLIGQLDRFYLRDISGNYSASLSGYHQYLRRADAALLDIFTVNTDPKTARLNINSPRPRNQRILPDKTLQSLLSAFPISFHPDTTKPVLKGDPLGTAVLSRLVNADWRNARPYRNANDLLLLGTNINGLLNTPKPDYSTNYWSSRSLLYNTAIAEVTANSGDPYPLPDGNNRSREQAFSQICDRVKFQSYRYRIHLAAQLLTPAGKTAARHYRTVLVDIIPQPQVNASTGLTTGVTYTYTFTELP